MRTLVIALLVLIIVVAALLGWAIYSIDTLMAWNKDRIIAAAERRIGQTIDYERVHVRFRGGLGVRIRGLTVSEHPSSGAGRFLEAADVRADLRIRPFLLNIDVTRVSVSAARARFMDLDFAKLRADARMEERWVTLNRLHVEVLDGELEGKGRMERRSASPRFEASLAFRRIDVGARLSGIDGFPAAQGRLDGDLRVTGQGRTWDVMKTTLTGTGTAAVSGGRILDFNLAEEALQGVTGIPALTALFSRRLKDRYPHIFSRATTEMERLDAEVEAADGRVRIKQATLEAKDYAVAGEGWVDFEGATAVDAVLTLSPGLSADLFPPARFAGMANGAGEVELPFKLKGTLTALRASPSRSLLEQMAKQGAGARLRGLLSLFAGSGAEAEPDEPAAEEPSETPAPKAPDAPRDPLQRLLDQGLKLFGVERSEPDRR